MATNVKNAIAKALINGVVTDLFLKTGVENVVITENGSEKTLADKLTEITNALGSYVKKEAGKGLSANDFTTELMTKLNGIAAGAQVNKIESIKVNGTAQAIGADKSVNITVPTKTSDRPTTRSIRPTLRWPLRSRLPSPRPATPAIRRSAPYPPSMLHRRTSCIW